MHNIFLIFQHEWQQKKRSGLFKLLFIAMQILLIVTLFTGWSQYKNTQDQQLSAQEIVMQQWLTQPDRHPHRVAHFGHFTFRPPSALSFFDNGVNHFVGNSIYIEAHKQNSAMFSNSQQSDVLLRFSDLSVATILLICWPLMLIALGFNSINIEYNAGTMRQLFSINVSIPVLITGKILAYLLISLLFIIPIFITCFGLIAWSDSVITLDIVLRITGLFVLYLIYCLIWISIILLVSSCVCYGPHALTLLIAIWFMLTIISPRILADIAAETYPQPSRNEFNFLIKKEISQVGDSHNPDDPHFNEFKKQLLNKYRVNDVSELPVNYRALVIQEGERISSEIYMRQYQSIMVQQQKQQNFISYWYWVNPYLLVRDLSMALSATDIWHFYDYENQTEAHRYARITQINQIHAEFIDAEHDRESKAEADHWLEFEDFNYQQPTLTQSIAPIKWRGFILFILIGLFAVFFSLPQLSRRLHELA
tara:strand:+ start:185 stop:1621 length:1437 start_codon:yes stop_codon:yes gene_type:complete